MNYALKLQSPASVLGPFRRKLKCCQERNYFCGHCLRRHLMSRVDAREFSNFTSNELMVETTLKEKGKLKKSEDFNNPALNTKQDNKNAPKRKAKTRYTELVKVSNFKSTKTKMSIEKIQASDVKAFAEESGLTFKILDVSSKNIYNSTRSYDPSLLNLGEVTMNVLQGQSITKASSKLSTNISKENISGLDNKSTEIQSNKMKLNLNPVEKLPKQSSNVKKNSKTAGLKTDLFKILPTSALKVVPLPKKKGISKKSVKSLQKLSSTDISYEEYTALNPDLLNDPNVNILTPEEQPEQSKRVDISKVVETTDTDKQFWEIDTKCRPFIFRQLVECQLDICVNCNMLDHGIDLMDAYRTKVAWKETKGSLDVVSVYNILLKALAQKGDWTTVCKLTNWMKDDGVVFNCQTYASLLECLGRVDKGIFRREEAWKEEIVNVLKSIYKKEILLNNIFTKSSLTKDQSEKILQTIRTVLPFFEVAPTKIKLNSNCSLLKSLYQGHSKLESPIGDELSAETLEGLVDEQLMNERNFDIAVKAISNPTLENGLKSDSTQNKNFNNLLENWKKVMLAEFIEDLKVAERDLIVNSNPLSLYFYMKTLPPEMFVDVMMQIIRNLVEFSGHYGPCAYILHRSLGEKIHVRYQTRKIMESDNFDKIRMILKKYVNWYRHPVGPATNGRQELQMILQDCGNAFLDTAAEYRWSDTVKIKLGKRLFDIMIRSTKISLNMDGLGSNIPAFYLVLRHKDGKTFEEIKCHPSVTKLFQKVGFNDLIFDVDQFPMVCPPLPWRFPKKGGFLLLPSDYIRKPRDEGGQRTDLRNIPHQQLYSTFDALNELQSVPWIVNEEVLDLALDIFRKGGSDELNVPRYPDFSPLPPIVTETRQDYREETRKRQLIITKRQNMYSLWCEALYRLSLTEHFRKKIFWLPQNLDFRGRVYPVPPHLNHLGSDLFRSLLLFAKGKPLGPNGFDWIKIHTINLTGTHKKKPIKERLKYANEMLDEMVDSAERPLTGNQWWTKSDDPWQTLAACKEIRNILMSPNPEKHVSRLPIHQDGSCNGLQHYAALGRDVIGAKSVNVTASETPQDVYSSVVEILEKKRAEDAAKGIHIAEALEGFITRKVVKRTIMTTVYGVTLYGARLQIKAELQDVKEFPEELVWMASGYLSAKTFESLQEMFTSAKEIQEWFIKCSNIITKKNDYVKWVTPLGLPVLQPYAKRRSGITRKWFPNARKQENAFAPNFIHSLDSCHMMMTALHCEQAGLTFASIHDCFWTHPSTVDVMNKICREQFILLHSYPILEELSNFFKQLYITGENSALDEEAKEIFSSVPKRGDLDLNNVRDSIYFFS